MMTKAEFEKARSAVARKAVPIVLGWVFGSALAVLSMSWGVGIWDDKNLLDSRFVLRGMFPVITLLAIFCILPIWFLVKLIYRMHGLLCLKCGSFLTSDPSVLTTGKCGKCQSVIFHV